MRRMTAILAAVAALSCGGGEVAGPGETAAAYIEAIGGREAVAAVGVIHTVDSLYMAGLSGTSEAWWRRDPFAGRVRVVIGPVSQDLLISGDSVWSVDRNGMLTPGDETAQAQAALARATVFQQAFLDPGALAAGPDTTIDGEPAHTLHLDAGGTPVTFHLSAETHLPVLTRTEVMGLVVHSRPGGYRETCGILFPGSTRDSIPALGQSTRSVSILVECNVRIPDSVFVLSGGIGEIVRQVPAEPHPFSLEGQHVYLRGSVCGRQADFLLDSGAGATVIDSALAEELGLEAAGEFSAIGLGGSAAFSFVEVPEYSAAGAAVRGQTLAVMPLDEVFYPATGRHLGVVLGYDFLSRFVAEIDFGARTITLHDPAGWSWTGRGSALPARRVMSLLAIEVVVEDGIPATLLLDTGAGGAVHLGPRFFEENPGFMAGRDTLGVTMQGVGGEGGASLFRIDSLRLGAYTVPGGLSTRIGEIPVLGRFDGILGVAVLSRFVVTLDYAGSRVILEPSSSFTEGLPENMTGLGARTDGIRVVVDEVIAGSPSEEAGILPGEAILAVDGRDPGADPARLEEMLQGSPGDRRELLLDGPSGRRTVTLLLRRLL